MSLARRVRAGIAIHAGVNVVFAAVAVLGAAGGSVLAEASVGDPVDATMTPPDGLPIHAVAPAHPLSGDPGAAAMGSSDVTAAADSPAVETGDAGEADAEADASGADAADDPPATTATTAAPDRNGSGRSGGERGGATRQVESTGYCLRGTTASGVQVGHGQAAMNGVTLGTEWLIHDGPQAGRVLEVTDRIGHSTEFDIWFADCDDARVYGRRTITVEQVG